MELDGDTSFFFCSVVAEGIMLIKRKHKQIVDVKVLAVPATFSLSLVLSATTKSREKKSPPKVYHLQFVLWT